VGENRGEKNNRRSPAKVALERRSVVALAEKNYAVEAVGLNQKKTARKEIGGLLVAEKRAGTMA